MILKVLLIFFAVHALFEGPQLIDSAFRMWKDVFKKSI